MELKKGEKKCYRCLMHEENPCAECPVVNSIEGPKRLSGASKVLRSIDAVEIQLESGELGHAMIFSAAEATEKKHAEELPIMERILCCWESSMCWARTTAIFIL